MHFYLFGTYLPLSAIHLRATPRVHPLNFQSIFAPPTDPFVRHLLVVSISGSFHHHCCCPPRTSPQFAHGCCPILKDRCVEFLKMLQILLLGLVPLLLPQAHAGMVNVCSDVKDCAGCTNSYVNIFAFREYCRFVPVILQQLEALLSKSL